MKARVGVSSRRLIAVNKENSEPEVSLDLKPQDLSLAPELLLDTPEEPEPVCSNLQGYAPIDQSLLQGGFLTPDISAQGEGFKPFSEPLVNHNQEERKTSNRI